MFRLIQTHEEHSAEVRCVQFTPDEKCVISCSSDRFIRVLDSLPLCRKKFTCHSHTVSSIVITEDGTTLISGSWDKRIMTWPLMNKSEQPIWISSFLEAMVLSIKLLPHNRIFSFQYGGILRIWQVVEQRLECSTISKIDVWPWINCSLSIWEKGPSAFESNLSKDSKKRLRTDNESMNLKCWIIIGGDNQSRLSHHIDSPEIPNFRLLEVVGKKNEEKIIIKEKKWTGSLMFGSVKSMAISLRGTCIALVTQTEPFATNMHIIESRLHSGEFIYHKELIARYKVTTLEWMTRGTEGTWLATGSGFGTIDIWNVKQGTCLLTCSTCSGRSRITCLGISPTNRTICSGDAAGRCRIWSLNWAGIEWECYGIRWTILSLWALLRQNRAKFNISFRLTKERKLNADCELSTTQNSIFNEELRYKNMHIGIDLLISLGVAVSDNTPAGLFQFALSFL